METGRSPGALCPASLTYLGFRPVRDSVSKPKQNKVDGILRNDTGTWPLASVCMHLCVYTPTSNRDFFLIVLETGESRHGICYGRRQLCPNTWWNYMTGCTRQQAGCKRQTASQIHPLSGSYSLKWFIIYLCVCVFVCMSFCVLHVCSCLRRWEEL